MCVSERGPRWVSWTLVLFVMPVLAAEAQGVRARSARPACVAVRAFTSDNSASTSPADAVERRAFVDATMQCMTSMHDDMHAALTSQGRSVDALFAEAMIPHHQGAVDMARQLLAHGRDPELRSLGLSIIAEQQAEITLLGAWLARHAEQTSATTGSSPLTTSLESDVSALATPARGPVPISPRDRVYTADQVSNTVSVIEPSSNRLLGEIRLGNRRPDLLSPLYKGQINVHGLGVSPDGRTLAVISTGSNGVTLIETATNRVKGTVYVGRNPHEGFFTPDGKELWVTIRGENDVAVIDPVAMRVVQKIVTAPGPGMVVFRPDGKVAFVDHSFTPELDVVDVAAHRVIRRIPVVSPFSPNLAMTADGQQVWLTHKDVGKVTVVNAQTYDVEGVIDTGPVTNHVNFAGVGGGTRVGGAAAGDFAYVTVGGENAVKVYSRDRRLVATIPVGAVPHGVWPSGDGSRVYVGLQQADAVAVIDTKSNTKVAEIPIGQSPQALVYVVDAVPSGSGVSNLVPLDAKAAPQNIRLTPASGGTGRGTVTIRSLGPVDGVDVTVSGLSAGTDYTLLLSLSGTTWPLATAHTDSTGRANVEAIAPTTIPRRGEANAGPRRLILVAGTDPNGTTILAGRLDP